MYHISRTQKTARDPLRPHGHDFAELFWIDAGEGTHIVNGQAFPIATGDLAFIRPGDFHSIQPKDSLHLTNLAFPRDVLDDLETRYSARTFVWRSETSVQLEPEKRARFNRWADELSNAPRDLFSLHRCLLNIMHALLPREFSLGATIPLWLQHACREMEKPENLVAGLDAFFHLAGRSREHTARTLKECCGVSPTEFLQNLRLQRAARMLEMSEQELLAIAFDCGFQNISHFYRLFKKRFGETPKAYRKRRQLLM
jgi:AraC family transcriptional regulator, dual regulator of chb operon